MPIYASSHESAPFEQTKWAYTIVPGKMGDFEQKPQVPTIQTRILILFSIRGQNNFGKSSDTETVCRMLKLHSVFL